MKSTRHGQLSRKSDGHRVLVVTGTPGVGKTSISELLASRIGGMLLSLGSLVEKERLYVGLDRKRDTLIADLEKVSERVARMVEDSCGAVIIEGHYAADVVSPERVKSVFLLRRDPRDLESVLRGRGYKEGKVRENLAAEILDVCLYDAVGRCGVEKVCEVDVTARKPEDVVEEILLILEGKKECKVGIVDWLGKLESEGRLDEYLEEF